MRRNSDGTIRTRAVIAFTILALLPLLAWAVGPSWWTSRGVIVPNAAPDDYAVANVGQVRNIAKQAYEEMKANLNGGAGSALDAIWATPAVSTDDYAAVNIGQLKNLAKPFYDRLVQEGLASGYPWAASATPADDYAVVNIGQVKNLFAFDIPLSSTKVDTDKDGLPDAWEQRYFQSLDNSPDADPDCDGLSNLEEYKAGSDPLDYYNGVAPILTSLVDATGQVGPSGLVSIRATRASDGIALAYAPVKLAVTTGAGQIAYYGGGKLADQIVVRTDMSGTASGYVSFSNYSASEQLIAEARFGSQSASLRIVLYPPVASPEFSLPEGSYSSAKSIGLSTKTQGATIRYTTDGSTPSSTTGNVYSSPVPISGTTTLKAIAVKAGVGESPVSTASYVIAPPQASAPVFSIRPDTLYYAPTVTISSATNGVSIAYTLDGSEPTVSGSAVTHGKLYTGPVKINSTSTLSAIAFGAGYGNSTITSGQYSIDIYKPSRPVFVYSPSATYSGALTVAILDPDVTFGGLRSIVYTKDGTTPVVVNSSTISNGTLYTGPVKITATTTFKAICVNVGYTPSDVSTAKYTIVTAAAAAPVFNPAQGAYAGAQTVTLSSATAGATIRYTTDGSTPTETNGAVYSAPLGISGTTQLRAMAFVPGAYGDSAVTDALFSIATSPIATINVLHDFTPAEAGDGGGSRLLQASDGNLYGTTYDGGMSGKGTVFSISPSGVYTLLVSFDGSNGANPSAALIEAGSGDLYGTTYYGGPADSGTIFKVTQQGVLTTLYSFTGPDGANPEAALTFGTDGNLYGSTYRGGKSDSSQPSGYGTIFRASPAGGLTTLVNCLGSKVFSSPDGDLILAVDGNFYGFGSDVVFKMTPSGDVSKLVSFYGANKGNSLQNALVQGDDGSFYGVTMLGGAGQSGTVFKIASDGAINTLVSFDGANGSTPFSGLMRGRNGNFYGTTSGGFDGAPGTLFRVRPDGAFTNLIAFNGANGSAPDAGLVQASDGRFYGTTSAGGLYNAGTIFRLTVPTTAAPVPSLTPAAYSAGQQLTLVSATSGATIRYTTDGSAPSVTNGTVYTGPLKFAATTTLKAIAYSTSLDESVITSATYLPNLQVASPVFSPGAGIYNNPQSVTLVSATSGATIRYTTDGSTPTETIGTLYSGPVTIGATTTLKAIAFKSGLTNSPVTSGIFGLNKPPVITPKSSPSGGIFGSTSQVTLSFDASDGDGAVSKMEIYRDGVLVATLTRPSVGTTWTFTETATLGLGTYTYYARVYDIQGTSTSSVSVTVKIVPVLPYATDFEVGEGYTAGTLSGQRSWTVASGSAQIIASDASHGSQSVALSAGATAAQIEQKFNTAGTDFTFTPVYIDLYIKPVAGANVDSGTLIDFDVGRIAFVRNGASGQLVAYDGDLYGGGTWKALAPAISLDGNQAAAAWQRLTMRINFDFNYGKSYDVYLNGAMIAADLKLRSSGAVTLAAISVRGSITTKTVFDDLHIGLSNPLFADGNNNGIEDAWEIANGFILSNYNRSDDPDGDGLKNVEEYYLGTDPRTFDTDGDGLSDKQERDYSLNPLIPLGSDPLRLDDPDGDGLSTARELQLGTEPNVFDSDGDGLNDGREVALGTNPLSSDTDGDGKTDSDEVALGINPLSPDTDGDGLTDSVEIKYGLDPRVPISNEPLAHLDADSDGLDTAEEARNGTDPQKPDTDSDGMPDLWEVQHGLPPTDASNRDFDTDGDGHTDFEEYQAGTDPSDFYDGAVPTLTLLAGGSQTPTSDGKLTVLVSKANGTPYRNAPVTLKATTSNLYFATSPRSVMLLPEITVRTDDNGLAIVYAREGKQ
jgi:uncharacterized repeat protein (TIGR03803 family)